jgi:hypothetical protein
VATDRAHLDLMPVEMLEEYQDIKTERQYVPLLETPTSLAFSGFGDDDSPLDPGHSANSPQNPRKRAGTMGANAGSASPVERRRPTFPPRSALQKRES